MVKKLFIIHLTFLQFVSFNLYSQTTIGSYHDPMPGTILDLKENNSTGVNSTKGLLLPRVNLTDTLNLYPMFQPGYNKAEQDFLHTGLTVYNVNKCMPKAAGPYAWDGFKWNLLLETNVPDLYTYTDQDNKPFLARKFGNAGIWMVQDLSTTKYDTIRDSYDNTINITTLEYMYPNDDNSLGTNYPWVGILYRYKTASNNSFGTAANNNRIQGMCPHGWHMPKPDEWVELEKELINNSRTYTSLDHNLTDDPAFNMVSDGPLKEPEINKNYEYGSKFRNLMISPCPVPGYKSNEPVDAISLNAEMGGFAIRLIGTATSAKVMEFYGERAGFWLASTDRDATARSRIFRLLNTIIHNNAADQNRYMAVRCKKNNDIP